MLVINANFGLGESVVSGQVDPDTIKVLRDPEFPFDHQKLIVGDTRVGNKKIKMVESGKHSLSKLFPLINFKYQVLFYLYVCIFF